MKNLLIERKDRNRNTYQESLGIRIVLEVNLKEYIRDDTVCTDSEHGGELCIYLCSENKVVSSASCLRA